MNRWFADDFDYRCTSDDSPELMNNIAFLSTLPPLVRDLMESSDFFVVLGDYVDPMVVEEHRDPETGLFSMPPDNLRELATLHNVPLKVIRRRNPEFQQHLLHEDRDEDDIERDAESEDALDHAESLDSAPPKAAFDLVEDVHREYSADAFPYPRDKRLKGYSRNLAKAIERGINAKALYGAIAEARKRNALTGSQIRRLWELHNLVSFQRDPEVYQQRIQRRKARNK